MLPLVALGVIVSAMLFDLISCAMKPTNRNLTKYSFNGKPMFLLRAKGAK